MSATSTHFKLGLFTLLGLAALLAIAFELGWRGTKSDTTLYHTYFDESVTGLETGSPVKYRGVMIGSVAVVQIASDRRLVDVTMALDVGEARSIGLSTIAPEVRAQLASQGITGVKFIDIDLFDPALHPAPQLSFRPDAHYIPSRPSLMKGLEGDVEVVGQRLPHLVETAVVALQRIASVLADFQDQRIPERLGKAVDNVNGAVSDLRALVRSADRAHLPDKAALALDALSTAVANVNGVVATIGGDAGLVASAQRATDSIGDVGRSTTGSAASLERTLRDLDDAALAIRTLAEAIDRDPDMLVKGRARAKGR